MSDFSISDALTAYLDDPQTILTPDADAALLDCENDPDAFSTSLINGVLHGIADAVGENPEAILQSAHLDSLQFLLKCAPTISLHSQLSQSAPFDLSLLQLSLSSSITEHRRSNQPRARSRQSPSIPSQSLGKVFDLVISALGAEAQIVHHEEQDGEIETAAHKRILETLGFLLQWCIAAVEAKSAEKPAAPARGKGAKGAKGKAAQRDGTWDPSSQLQTALDIMAKVMKLKLARIFVTTSERDTFIGLFTRPTYLILESETRVKSTAIRMHAFKVLCVAIKHHGHAHGAQTSIIQNLTYFEHLAEPMAEFLNILAEQYDYPQLAEEVMKELSNKEFSANDTKGPKSVSTFVARLSELAPRVVQRQVTYLAKLLESENYTLRCAIIEVCGNLIAMLSKVEESERREEHKGQINAFFDVLEERFLDINPYSRCRAIQVYVKLCDLDVKYPKRRQKAAELATQSLEDKSSNVRRNAIKLLGKLIGTHPFAVLHGGQLSHREWSERLDVCETELSNLKPPAGTPGLGERVENEPTVDESLLLEATQVEGAAEQAPKTEEELAAELIKSREQAATAEAMNKLQLTRRYYVECLRFIETLHEASPHVTQLLSSKNKSEVIEAMDFFVTADAYELETAKPGIRRMLRLIWTKGNSDEGKGVQTHLIECYKGLFFAAPGNFNPNDAANYVARNMISLTFGSTPAELTSLEQLLATMMKEKAINELVIQKLWQVYGIQKREISKSQRRGAIIVLGMLALADPDIVVREMETCLRIGLGAIGRRDLVLARYTCVALMRMTNNKHAKGTEGKPSTRLPNDHAVLIRLANLLEIETESKDWYGLAEQAIGAMYALSNHPDVLCSEVLRRKTKAVFMRRPPAPKEASKKADIDISQVDEDGDVEMSDMAEEPASEVEMAAVGEAAPANDGSQSALALSQLLFAVGHIALKQIVHLELCEQDFKRRKAEKEKTNPSPIKKMPGSRTSAAKKAIEKKEEEQDELDLIAGTTEDDFTDAIQHIRERELLYGQQSLLAQFGPLVKEICSNNTSYSNAELQAQAALCMAKLMCVSSEYCEANLGLLITILERSPSSITRSNLVVALGDMAVCFNHLIDENTDFLYRRLSDASLQVKRTCLMTLTFLILAGQVKVKGQLGEMAKCVEDSDERIREMSRMFFAELAGKDNAVYNHFVDMFSLLSADEDLDEERFRKVIKFLASFIEKVCCLTFETKTEIAMLTTWCTRTSMRNNWLASSHRDYNALKASGSGMTWLMHLDCCRTRMMTLRSWSEKAVRWLRLVLRQTKLCAAERRIMSGVIWGWLAGHVNAWIDTHDLEGHVSYFFVLNISMAEIVRALRARQMGSQLAEELLTILCIHKLFYGLHFGIIVIHVQIERVFIGIRSNWRLRGASSMENHFVSCRVLDRVQDFQVKAYEVVFDSTVEELAVLRV